VPFSTTVLKYVVENLPPPEISKNTCAIFDHRSGFQWSSLDHLS